MKKPHQPSEEESLVREAKALVALAFRNGPIENLHAGKPCPTCRDGGYSRISDKEMKAIMKAAVTCVYALFSAKKNDPVKYEQLLQLGDKYTRNWDPPEDWDDNTGQQS